MTTPGCRVRKLVHCAHLHHVRATAFLYQRPKNITDPRKSSYLPNQGTCLLRWCFWLFQCHIPCFPSCIVPFLSPFEATWWLSFLFNPLFNFWKEYRREKFPLNQVTWVVPFSALLQQAVQNLPFGDINAAYAWFFLPLYTHYCSRFATY